MMLEAEFPFPEVMPGLLRSVSASTMPRLVSVQGPVGPGRAGTTQPLGRPPPRAGSLAGRAASSLPEASEPGPRAAAAHPTAPASRRPQRATGARGQGRGASGGGLCSCASCALGLQPPWRPHPDFSETLWREGNVNKTSNLHIACLHRNKSYRIHSTPGSRDFCLIYSQSQSTGRPRKSCKFGSQPLKDSQYHN